MSYLIYALLLSVGLRYQMANLIALVIGILFSFKTQGHLVFNNRNNRLLGRFILSWTVIYVCVIFMIGRIIALGFDAYAAGALVLPFSAALSYVIQKYFVFKGSSQPTQG
ncbi:MAG: GtrA family protein [Gammaproteobacteria bacterium]|nr:GtrA family protein [Gammaproteobacteria bacterium]